MAGFVLTAGSVLLSFVIAVALSVTVVTIFVCSVFGGKRKSTKTRRKE